MDLTKREVKQMIIAAIYVVAFGLLAFFFARPWFAVEPTCLDGILNQNETTVDCGGVCGACAVTIPALDLQIIETNVVYGGPEHKDVLVKILNPNDLYGAPSVNYAITLKDDAGNIVSQATGRSFILPKETKYLMQVGLPDQNSIASSAEVSLSDVEWETFSGYRERPLLTIGHKEYGPVSSGIGFGQANGTLVNESGFDFQSIAVKVILRDQSGKPIALNQTELRTVIAGERRDIGPLVFPAYFPGEVAVVETESEADVYHSDNFIRQYLPGGAFQQY